MLLQQLRRQSKSSCTSPSQNSHKSIEADENTKNITSSRDAAIIEQTGPSAVGVPITHKEADAINTKSKKKMIEVCLGPDCAVAGGGAALLEIEDLLHKCTIKGDMIAMVRAGGCRDQCTEGPNVRILSVNSDGANTAGGRRRNLEEEEVDFHKVNCPEACRRVMDSLLCTSSSISAEARQTDDHNYKSSSSSSDNNIIVSRLLSRKEDARRWKAHRERAAKERRLQAISRTI
jgi:hypothetical protein